LYKNNLYTNCNNQFDILNHLQCFDASTKDGISIEILKELVRICEDNDASLEGESLSYFINFILEKERSHKYVEQSWRKNLKTEIPEIWIR